MWRSTEEISILPFHGDISVGNFSTMLQNHVRYYVSSCGINVCCTGDVKESKIKSKMKMEQLLFLIIIQWWQRQGNISKIIWKIFNSNRVKCSTHRHRIASWLLRIRNIKLNSLSAPGAKPALRNVAEIMGEIRIPSKWDAVHVWTRIRARSLVFL